MLKGRYMIWNIGLQGIQEFSSIQSKLPRRAHLFERFGLNNIPSLGLLLVDHGAKMGETPGISWASILKDATQLKAELVDSTLVACGDELLPLPARIAQRSNDPHDSLFYDSFAVQHGAFRLPSHNTNMPLFLLLLCACLLSLIGLLVYCRGE